MYFTFPNHEVFCFAGLWEPREREGQSRPTFTILTTTPNEVVAKVHDRMPVIVQPQHFDMWLGKAVPDPAVFEPFPAEETVAVPVSTRVNSPRNDDASLITPVESSGSSLWG